MVENQIIGRLSHQKLHVGTYTLSVYVHGDKGKHFGSLSNPKRRRVLICPPSYSLCRDATMDKKGIQRLSSDCNLELSETTSDMANQTPSWVLGVDFKYMAAANVKG